VGGGGGIADTYTSQLEASLVLCAQRVSDNGGNADYIIAPSAVTGYFPSFALSAGRNVDVVGGDLYNYVDIYRSQFGSFDVVQDRSMKDGVLSMLLMDFEYSAVPILDTTQDYALAKDGDRDRREVVRESSYALLNTKACGVVDEIPATLLVGSPP
jgi:hypothetical protein